MSARFVTPVGGAFGAGGVVDASGAMAPHVVIEPEGATASAGEADGHEVPGGAGEPAGGAGPTVGRPGVGSATDHVPRPATATPKTTTTAKTTVTRATASSPSRAKTASAATFALPKTADSNWIAASRAVVCQQVVFIRSVTNREGPAKLWIVKICSEERGPPMSQHPNARLTPWGRQRLVERIEAGEAVGEVARQMGVSRQTASKWVTRARAGEPMGDRPSRPRRLARLTPPQVEALVREARSSLLLGPLALSAETGVPARTCARIVARAGLPRLADVDRVTGEARRRGPATRVRYERERPGELLHVDVKKVARIPEGGGWRALGRGCGSRRGAGRSCLHVAVDDRSRVAYAELLPDERKGTCSAFMGRCVGFFAGLGVRVERVMTDNGPGYRSREFNDLLAGLGVRHKYTKPFSPWQNGKVERMNRTLAQEWQYARAWESEASRADALEAFLDRYNWDRPHSACGGLPPMSRIVGANNVLAHNT